METNVENMTEMMENVRTGEVTYAVRNTSVGGKEIKVNDIMGIDDDGIKEVGQDIKKSRWIF